MLFLKYNGVGGLQTGGMAVQEAEDRVMNRLQGSEPQGGHGNRGRWDRGTSGTGKH